MIAFFLSDLSAQTPEIHNDDNWQLVPEQSEEFRGGSLMPFWSNDYWWNQHPDKESNQICLPENVQLDGEIGHFIFKREDKFASWEEWYWDPITQTGRFEPQSKTFNYTLANISTGNADFRYEYGYFESKVKLPAYDVNPCLGQQNYAWWMFNRSGTGSYDIDWSEIDFFEIITDTDISNSNPKRFTCNTHIIKPFDYNEKYIKWYRRRQVPLLLAVSLINPSCLNDMIGNKDPFTNLPLSFSNPAFTWNKQIDPQVEYYCDGFSENGGSSNSRPYYKALYESRNIDEEWHIYGCEWLPDQIKFYIDGKLHFRLEGDFTYNYNDTNDVPKTVNAIRELILPMPMIFGYNRVENNPSACIGNPSLDMQVDYIRYYQLKKDCGTNLNQPPVYNFCTATYQQKVYENVVFGEIKQTPPFFSCDPNTGADCALIDGCDITIRAKNIKFEDGFRVTAAEGSRLYAHDVDCSKLP